MLRVIQLAKPQWVIAENVRGLLTLQGGLVFEQVCLDLEREDYEVQPFIIPAVAVNAPHRRDRVWFVAYRTSKRPDTGECNRQERHILRNENRNAEKSKQERNRRKRETSEVDKSPENSLCERGSGGSKNGRQILECESTETENAGPSWEKNWLEVATELCGMDDGLSPELDFAGWSKSRHRVERLKSLGNSIVPQVAIEIMKAIKFSICHSIT